MTKVLITFHLAQPLLEKILRHPNIEVLYDPTLLGEPRYQNDQHGGPVHRTAEQEEKLRAMMREAEVLFGYIPAEYQAEVKRWLPNLRWMQSASAGIGWRAKTMGWTETDIMFTTSSGIHSTPLAEFCLMAMLMHVKGYHHMAEEKRRKHWARTCTTELRGKTLAVVGLGRVGTEVSRLAKCLGVHVLGAKRHVEAVDPQPLNVDELYGVHDLKAMLGRADFVVIIVPETAETRGLIGREEFNAMKTGAYLINVARGTVVDEAALVEALGSGRLGGAALDVFELEPLPEDSPLWGMPNVIISPHSASTADTENAKLTEVFLDNMDRYHEGTPLRNLLDKTLLY
ncbi:D-2-hydroxyacid dehydrogenase [Candidatus Bathyarchaeota archaeon]|nr:D-2-hydroxyacid dehydrogenase [Candidatus Bathyarchaeota archaeon]